MLRHYQQPTSSSVSIKSWPPVRCNCVNMYTKYYNYSSYAKPCVSSRETVVNVQPAPPLATPIIPLRPVQRDQRRRQDPRSNSAVPWELVSWRAYTPVKKKKQAVPPPTNVFCNLTGVQHVQAKSWGAMQHASTSVTRNQAATMVSTKVRLASQRVVRGRARRAHATPVKFTLPWLLKSGGAAPTGLPNPEPGPLGARRHTKP